MRTWFAKQHCSNYKIFLLWNLCFSAHVSRPAGVNYLPTSHHFHLSLLHAMDFRPGSSVCSCLLASFSVKPHHFRPFKLCLLRGEYFLNNSAPSPELWKWGSFHSFPFRVILRLSDFPCISLLNPFPLWVTQEQGLGSAFSFISGNT